MAARVLVTRPEPAASNTAARLQALGFEAVLLPLSRTVALPFGGSLDAADFDLVAITSANAVRYASPVDLRPILDKPCLAVGDKTASAAIAAGFADVKSADGDVEGLLRLVFRHAQAGSRVAYLCGRVRRPDFEAAAGRNGWAVTPVETYDTIDILPADQEVGEAMDGRPVDFVLVYSLKAAQALNRLLGAAASARWIEDAVFCCLSPRIAEALAVEPARIRLSDRPEQDGLFAVLTADG